MVRVDDSNAAGGKEEGAQRERERGCKDTSQGLEKVGGMCLSVERLCGARGWMDSWTPLQL